MRNLILIFILLAPVVGRSAELSKVIFNLRGEQFATLSGPGTVITPDADIIWDSAKDGPIPEGAVIGVLERAVVDGKPELRENADLVAAAAAKAAEVQAEANARAQRLAKLKSIEADLDAAATVAQVKAVLRVFLKALTVELGKDK